MVEIVALIAGARAAIDVVKQAVEVGQDIQGLAPQIMSFFDFKEKAIQENNKLATKKTFSGSATGQAMQNIMALKELEDAEKYVKEMLIYTGQGDIWERIVAERTRLVKEQKAKELSQRRERARKLSLIKDVLTWGCVSILAVLLSVSIVYFLIFFLK
jgi:hypothetical protein